MGKHVNTRLFVTLMAIPAFIWLVPILWMLSLSFQPNDLLQRTTTDVAFGLIPAQFTFDNYAAVMSLSNTPRWFMNSLIVAVMTTLGVLLVAAPAGYAFARMNFPFKRVLLMLCLIGLAVPEQAIFIPMYTMFADLGWLNTYHGLAIPRIATPIGLFLMYQFMRGVPREIEEAAMIDDIGRVRIFFSIVLPLMRPAMITLAIVTFLYAWNDYLWPLVAIQRTADYTLAVGIASSQENFAQTEGLGRLMASGIFASLPVIVFYLIFQKYVVRAIALGGSKG
ncbi:carbohydrate ABC transporter permease [Rhodophyticola sp. CCM32]|uniref:carbohydrate ABC transporter permease n=1 Tax=Rhodophyticola sp. CCM32 TaxID=2916397 RepID=UPI00107FC74D|nr:carbohydrate ABC transporter permease [Rhodophyticola sp. CCM32]QBY00800.1 carbohydrate ABC transporter permease [Rhodophyticola sp. CCM32]